MLTQRQRSAKRRRLDKADAIACAERALNRCEVCGQYAKYPWGELHHARRKRTEADRRNRDWHVWLCRACHRRAHGLTPGPINTRCEEIIGYREK